MNTNDADRTKMGRTPMDKTQVDKMQQDLDAVREALGCDLPFDRNDVRFSLVLAVAAGFWGVWALFFTHLGSQWLNILGASPMLLATAVGAFWMWLRKRAWRKERPLAARTVALDLRITIIFTLAMVVSVVVGLKTGFTHPLFYATILFWGAIAALFLGMMGRAWRRYLASAAGLGVISPLLYLLWDAPTAGLTAAAAVVMLTLLADAVIIYTQLRRNRVA